MILKRSIVCIVIASLCFLSQARPDTALHILLPRPKLKYFSLLSGLRGKPAILARMAVALNPRGTTLGDVLAAAAGAAQPEWVTARVCHLLRTGRGAAARPFFADTPSSKELWQAQFATPRSLLAKLVANETRQSRIPWEIQAGPLACVGWLLPEPRRKIGTSHAPSSNGVNPWGSGGTLFSFNLLRQGGRFRILGYQDLPIGDPFAAVCMGVTSGGVSLPIRRNIPLEHYMRIAYRTSAKGCRLAKQGKQTDFSLFFRLRRVPKTLLSEVKEFRHGNWPPKSAKSPSGKVEGTAAKPKADPFDLATTYFLKRAQGLKPVWFIAGRGVYYALFSGEYLGKHHLWLMKLRKSADGFRWYGFTQGLAKHACPDGLLGSDSTVTPTDIFLAKEYLKSKAKKEQAQ